MRKLVTMLSVVAILAMGSSSWAAISLTFDGTQAYPADTIITNQYDSLGVNFLSGDIASQFTNLTFTSLTNFSSLVGGEIGTQTIWTDQLGSGGVNTNYVSGHTPTSNFLGLNKGTSPALPGVAIQFDSLLTSLSFELFRSGTTAHQNTPVTIALFNTQLDGGPVTSPTVITAYNDESWKLFDSTLYTTSQFDLAVVYAATNNRFLMDNINAAPVPIPPAVFLFGSGLSGLFFFRRRKNVA